MSTTKKSGDKKPSKADLADKHVLYEESVQSTDFEYEFVDTNFERIRGRKAKSVREDFCGTARMCCEWVRGRDDNVALGVDLDADVLQWGKDNHLAKLTDAQRARVTLVEENVLSVDAEKTDVVLAMNFSWQIFEQRELLKSYFASVRDSLVDDGIFFLDMFGGFESQKEMKEKTKHKGFTYVWQQKSYDPITGHMVCAIHFHFKDGSKIKNAFVYEWRLWGLPELKEVLEDAGFSKVTIYWQGWDEDDDEEADGDFIPTEKGADADAGWIAMISAEK